jgi:hypothetical protein
MPISRLARMLINLGLETLAEPEALLAKEERR